MSKALTGRKTVDRGCEHRPQEQHHTVGILMMGSHGVLDQLERTAADLRHRALRIERKPVSTFDAERHVAFTDVIEAKVLVEQPNEGSDRARGVVVLGLAEKQRAPSFEVAKVHI